MSHYFENDSNLKSEFREIVYKYDSLSFTFKSDNGVFSKKGIDFGSRLLLETYLENENIKQCVLDIGCGYGFLGIMISLVTGSHVDMVDINKRAVHLTKLNTKKTDLDVSIYESDAYSEVKELFDIVITNPPIRVGKSKLLEILEGSFDHLKEEGSLYFVIRKDQGAESIKKTLEAKHKVYMLKRSKGYFIYKVSK